MGRANVLPDYSEKLKSSLAPSPQADPDRAKQNVPDDARRTRDASRIPSGKDSGRRLDGGNARTVKWVTSTGGLTRAPPRSDGPCRKRDSSDRVVDDQPRKISRSADRQEEPSEKDKDVFRLDSQSSCARLVRTIRNKPSDPEALAQASASDVYGDTAQKFCSALAAMNRLGDWCQIRVRSCENGDEIAKLRVEIKKERARADRMANDLSAFEVRAVAAEKDRDSYLKKFEREKERAARFSAILISEAHRIRSVVESRDRAVSDAKTEVKAGLKTLLQDRLDRIHAFVEDTKNANDLALDWSQVAGTLKCLTMLRDEKGVPVPQEMFVKLETDRVAAKQAVDEAFITDLIDGDYDAGTLVAEYEDLEAQKACEAVTPSPNGGEEPGTGEQRDEYPASQEDPASEAGVIDDAE